MTRATTGFVLVALLGLAACGQAPASSPAPSLGPTASGALSGTPASTAVASPTTTPFGVCDPVRVTVASLGIDEPVVAQGLDAKGQLNPTPKQTVWHTGSPRPGERGISVIAGHVQNIVPDVFWELDKARPGDAIDVGCADGRVVPLSVTRTKSVDKVALQSDATVWGASDVPVVVLITCDRNSRVVNRHRVNNFVVWTQPRA